jgi:glycosyltransferase involved in cell wall biosynthesis
MIPARKPALAADARRIVVLIDNLEIGGAQNLLETQVAQMRDSHSFLIINFRDESPLAARLAALGADVWSNRLGRLIDLPALLRLRREIARWAPDLIHSHLLYATVAGAPLARWLKVPHVVTLHNEKPELSTIGDRAKSALERRALSRGTDLIIACGERVAVAQRDRTGATPLITVMNRVRPASRIGAPDGAGRRRELGVGPQTRIVFAAGRLVAAKGFDILIAAFAQVLRGREDVVLLIAGEGEGRASLEKQAADLNLGDRVRCLGPVTDVPRLLQIADAFALSSRYEGLPLVLVEALAAGCPVIATRVGDVTSVMSEASGLLVEPEHVPQMAAALKRILDDDALRHQLSIAALEASRPFTDLARFAAELETAYAEARRRHDHGK